MKYAVETIQQALSLKKQGMKSRAIAAALGVSKSIVNYWCAGATAGAREAAELKPVADGYAISRHEKRKQLNKKRYIITSAQNNTHIHRKFWQTLLAAKDFLGAELIVSTFTYNRHGFSNLGKNDEDLWYAPELKPYIVNEPVELAKGLALHGELNITPTAVNPLSGLQNYVQNNSGIFPHCKVALKSLPSHPKQGARFLYTTGAVTLMNYRNQKAGIIAEFDHVFGALLVEVDGAGEWFVRQLNAETDTGCFYDLNVRYTPEGAELSVGAVEAINMPDLHMENVTERMFNLVVDMQEQLSPKRVLLHDTIDYKVRNHHNISDPVWRFNNYHHGNESVEDSLKKACNLVYSAFVRDGQETIVVRSNHDKAIETWLNQADYRNDPENAVFFLTLQKERYEAMLRGDSFNALEYVYRRYTGDSSVVFLEEDADYNVLGIACGWHGHNGNNGARGSNSGYRLLGVKVNKGHSHTAEILGGVYCSGVLSEDVFAYCKGPSSWSCSFIITYTNGKRAIVTQKKGSWRA